MHSLPQYGEDESPLDKLDNASYCYASAIKAKKTDASAHLHLGLVLEERYLAEDMYGLNKEVSLTTPMLLKVLPHS